MKYVHNTVNLFYGHAAGGCPNPTVYGQHGTRAQQGFDATLDWTQAQRLAVKYRNEHVRQQASPEIKAL